MQRAHLVLGALVVSLCSDGQDNYWSLYGSDAGRREPRRLSSRSTGTCGT